MGLGLGLGFVVAAGRLEAERPDRGVAREAQRQPRRLELGVGLRRPRGDAHVQRRDGARLALQPLEVAEQLLGAKGQG